jgi:predicted MFS family arabinose efflux permease
MGVAGALIMPTTLAVIKHVFPPAEQSRAIAVWTAAAGIGVPLGPVVGGLLLDAFWWGSVFLVNLPVAGLALVGAAVLVPESRDEAHPGLDLTGALLSVAGLVALVGGLVQGPEWGWASPGTWSALLGGLALLAAFGAWERRAAHPMLAGSLFRDRRFAGAAGAVLCVAFALYGVLYLLTQYLQFALGLDPLAAGLRMLAICALVVTSALSPRLVSRVGLRATVTAGLVAVTAAAAAVATVDAHGEDRALLALGLVGVGLGLAMPAAADAILASAPREQSGAGSAVTDTAMQVGGALGIAVTGGVLTTSYRAALPPLDGLPAPAREAAGDSLGGAHAVAGRSGGAGDGLRAAADQAFGEALTRASLTAAALAAAGTLVAAAVLPRRSAAPPAPGRSADRPDALRPGRGPAGEPGRTGSVSG